MADPTCTLAAYSEKPCSGALVRCHLISQQRLRIEYPEGAVWLSVHPQAFSWASCVRDGLLHRPGGPEIVRRISLSELQADERGWVWGCGGAMGPDGHHGEFDGYRLKPPRSMIPPETIAFADELRLLAFLDLDRRYDQDA